MKRYLKLFTGMLAMMAILLSCREEKFEPVPMASINVVNAIVGGKNIKMNTNAVDSAVVNGFKVFNVDASSGEQKLSIYPSGSPSTTYYSTTLSSGAGEIYSLYLTGQPAAVEGLMVKESFSNPTDSLMSVRIVNLSPGNAGINVTLSGTPTVNEFSGLAYKQVSEVKKYPVGYKVANTYFTFQVRNPSTNAILATYAFTVANLVASRKRNVTLVYRGITGGTGTSAPGITFVPNY